MFDKNRLLLMGKLLILVVALIITISLTPVVFSRYETEAATVAQTNIAFYILKENYYTENLSLLSMIPQSAPYVYNFTVANNDGTNRVETDMEYDLSIITTTNLPLTYELYINEAYNDQGATNAIVSQNITADDDGAYFKTITTPKKTFGFATNQSNSYQLVIYFPTSYTNYKYQDIAEMVRIVINSKQVLD